jgi:protein O-mannosyl-transferase
MPESQHSKPSHRAIATGLLAVALIVTWFAYSPGISGGLHFDDPHNLGGLSEVRDRDSALRFIVSGQAGPLGRPLALATFVPQADAWPDQPDVFLRANIVIHLVNALLVSGFLYLLGLARGSADRDAAYAAVGGAALWMVMPILASSSLFIVQRMTTVSATFVLLGAIGYLLARQLTMRRPILGLLLMTIALGIGAGLGALAKESGVLLIVFVLAAEATLLTRPQGIRSSTWRIWFTAVLLAPAALLGWYLVDILPYPDSVVHFRGFNGAERLITQAEILWRYLYLAFLPSPPALGPYHDDYRILTSFVQPAAIISVGAWLSIVALAFFLRQKAPLLTFAVAWFLGGHLIESFTVPLELYYEHRNYLPMIGPVYALAAGMLSVSGQWRRWMRPLLAVYFSLMAALLFSVTSLWGNPPLAAEIWQIYRPDSLRATERLAEKCESEGDPRTALRVLRSYADRNTQDTGVRITILQISCQIERELNHSAFAEKLAQDLRDAPYTPNAVNGLFTLHELIRRGSCPQLSQTGIYSMAEALLANPRYALPPIVHNIHVLLGRIAMEFGDLDLTMHHMESALAISPNPQTLALSIEILNSAGLQAESEELIRTVNQRRPRHPIKAALWDQQVRELQNNLEH